jgi:hypothetical protein
MGLTAGRTLRSPSDISPSSTAGLPSLGSPVAGPLPAALFPDSGVAATKKLTGTKSPIRTLSSAARTIFGSPFTVLESNPPTTRIASVIGHPSSPTLEDVSHFSPSPHVAVQAGNTKTPADSAFDEDNEHVIISAPFSAPPSVSEPRDVGPAIEAQGISLAAVDGASEDQKTEVPFPQVSAASSSTTYSPTKPDSSAATKPTDATLAGALHATARVAGFSVETESTSNILRLRLHHHITIGTPLGTPASLTPFQNSTFRPSTSPISPAFSSPPTLPRPPFRAPQSQSPFVHMPGTWPVDTRDNEAARSVDEVCMCLCDSVGIEQNEVFRLRAIINLLILVVWVLTWAHLVKKDGEKFKEDIGG